MKRIKIAILSILLFAFSTFAQDKFIAITQIVEHPALDATKNGVIDYLKEVGFVAGKNLKVEFESAQGNIPNTISIAKKFVGKKPDAIISIATPSAQAISAQTKSIPHIFSAVTDPVAAKIVPSLKKPGGNTTGVSDLTPIDKHLDLIKAIMPNIKSLGVLYNAGETNSVSIIKLVDKFAEQYDLKIIKSVAVKTADVLTAAKSLIGKVEAIYVPTDNTIVSAFESVVKVGIDSNIPVFAGDTSSVERGAVAALGFNYYDVGIQTGKIVAAILNGKNPGSIDVQGVNKSELFVNLNSAKKMGVEIPKILQTLSKKVIE